MRPGMPSDATVAIPVMDPDPVDFRECLARAAAAGRPVMVIDMSRGDAARMEAERHERVVYVPAPDSTGTARSRNRVLAMSPTDKIVFLDSDAFPRGDWVSPLVRALEDSTVGAVAPRVLPRWSSPPPRLFRSHTALLWLSTFDLGAAPRDVDVVVGTSFAVHRQRTPTSFDERLGPGLRPNPKRRRLGEETDFCHRTRSLGYRVHYEPASIVEHRVTQTPASWRWMWRRAYGAGLDQAFHGDVDRPALEKQWMDVFFKVACAPPFLAGRRRLRRRQFAVPEE